MKELELFSLEKGKGGCKGSHQYIKEAFKEDRSKLFLEVLGGLEAAVTNVKKENSDWK